MHCAPDVAVRFLSIPDRRACKLLPPTTMNLADIDVNLTDEDNPIDEISRIEGWLVSELGGWF